MKLQILKQSLVPAFSDKWLPTNTGDSQTWTPGTYIVGNVWGRKLGEKYDFHGEKFRGLLAFAVPKDTTTPNFVEKTFANSHKTAKFAKVFYLESFPLYGIHMCGISSLWQTSGQFVYACSLQRPLNFLFFLNVFFDLWPHATTAEKRRVYSRLVALTPVFVTCSTNVETTF